MGIKRMKHMHVRLKPEYIEECVNMHFCYPDGEEDYEQIIRENETDDEWKKLCNDLGEAPYKQVKEEGTEGLPLLMEPDDILFVRDDFYGMYGYDLYRYCEKEEGYQQEYYLFLTKDFFDKELLKYPIWKAKYFEVVKQVSVYVKDEEFYK